MRTIPLVKHWSGECEDVVGRLELMDDQVRAMELAPCSARLDFAMEKQDDGTVRIVAARIRLAPVMPSAPS